MPRDYLNDDDVIKKTNEVNVTSPFIHTPAVGMGDMCQLRRYSEGWGKISDMDLATVLQRLYDSEINVTIPTLWDGGFDFALISYMEWEDAGRTLDYEKTFISVEPVNRPDRPDPWH